MRHRGRIGHSHGANDRHALTQAMKLQQALEEPERSGLAPFLQEELCEPSAAHRDHNALPGCLPQASKQVVEHGRFRRHALEAH